jgi:transcription elongation factor GreA
MIGNKAVWLELTARLDVGTAPSGAEIQSTGGLAFPDMNAESGESKNVSCVPCGAHDRRTEAMVEKVPMTAGGYAALEVELKRRQSEDRPRIIEHIAEARSHGDLSENAEYHAAKEDQSHNEGRIAELEDKLARADIIDISKLSGDTVMFGATVTLVDEDTEKKAVWQIVGEPEADAKKGRISITSPLARALIGKKKGATVEVVAPGGAKAYEITKVEFR